MRKTIKYIATALILVLAASCNKNEDIYSGDNLIRFAPQSVQTKATVNADADLTAQDFAVVGLLNGTSHFANVISNASGSWAYTSPADAKYYWKAGTHKFFAYTDGAGTLSGQKVSVSKTLKADGATADKTKDLLFSEVYETTDVAWKAADSGHNLNSGVPLHFHHMLSAVSIVVKNCTDLDVNVTSVSAPAIPNKGTAEVDFGTLTDGVPAVSFGGATVDGAFVTASAIGATTLATDETIDVLTMTKAAGSYQVIWPQTLPSGDNAVSVTLSYTMGDDTYADKTVTLPADTWEAGKKYEYVLMILPTKVQLVFKVMPWESVDVAGLDTKDDSINMTNVTWQNVKVTVGGEEKNTLGSYYVYMYKNPVVNGTEYTGYYPAQGFFTFNYPQSGLFKIELIQASYWDQPVPEGVYEVWIYDYSTSAFRKMDAAGEDLADWLTDDGFNTIYFQVRATSTDLGSHPEYRAQIEIKVDPTGTGAEWISAYSEIRANYACVIDAE